MSESSDFKNRDHLVSFLKQLEEKRMELRLEKPDALKLLAEMYGANEETDDTIGKRALPKEFERLRHILDFYDVEAARAREGGALWSMCLMTTAHLEATLLMLAYLDEDQVRGNAVFTNREYQKGQPKISNLKLNELIDLGIQFKWLPSTLVSPLLAEYVVKHRREMERVSQLESLPEEHGYAFVRFLQGIRNSIHPSQFMKGLTAFTIDELESACVMADAAYVEIRPSLLRAMLSLSENLKIKPPRTGPLVLNAR